MTKTNRYIVGLYATSPTLINWNKNAEKRYFDAIKESINNIRGLELPFWGHSLHPFDDNFLLENMDPSWEHVLTCVPGNMEAIKNDPHFGLASDDEEGRQRALQFYKRAQAAISKLNNFYNTKKIMAVHIVSTPKVPQAGVSSSTRAFTKSIQELASWDWEGASLVVEHCDSAASGHAPIKGFLAIEDEIESLIKAGPTQTNLGMVINWGRSVLEYRGVSGAIRHIKTARDNGLLRGLIFSGTSEKDSPYGVWADSHMPAAEAKGITNFEKHSLLTFGHIKESLIAADYRELDYLGIKVLAMPMEEASLERRVGINRDTLILLDHAISEIETTPKDPKKHLTPEYGIPTQALDKP